MNGSVNILLTALAIPAILLSGCQLGPNYVQPKVEHPPAFKSQAATQPAPPIQAEWWRLYQDPVLDDLIATANQSNQNLRQAVARVDQARALARVAASFLLPTVTADPSYTRTRTSFNRASIITGQPVHQSSVSNDWRIPFDLSYEIDVWGAALLMDQLWSGEASAIAASAAPMPLTPFKDALTIPPVLRRCDPADTAAADGVFAELRIGNPAEHDERRPCRPAPGADPPQHLKTVDVRQHAIENYQSRKLRLQHPERPILAERFEQAA